MTTGFWTSGVSRTASWAYPSAPSSTTMPNMIRMSLPQPPPCLAGAGTGAWGAAGQSGARGNWSIQGSATGTYGSLALNGNSGKVPTIVIDDAAGRTVLIEPSDRELMATLRPVSQPA